MHLTKEKGLSSDEADALKVYLERFGESRDGCNPGMAKIMFYNGSSVEIYGNLLYFFFPKVGFRLLGFCFCLGPLC